VHFGEYGNISFVPPMFAREVMEFVRKEGGLPFLTDTTSVYAGRRRDAISYIELAQHHGFSGLPIIIADGLRGESGVQVQVNLPHLKEVSVASGIYYSDSMIVISHFKGHLETGFGGAIKNLGMGCTTPKEKMKMHSEMVPIIHKEKCVMCFQCKKWCTQEAIVEEKGEIKIIDHRCIGCGTCIAVCPERCIDINWRSNPQKVQEMMAECAKGVVKNKKVGYLNFLLQITKHCDCAPTFMPTIVEDIGILGGYDPVSIDKASFDMVNERMGGEFIKLWEEINPLVQIEYGEKIGLGEKEYTIVEIE
jgi:hypothetical protein